MKRALVLLALLPTTAMAGASRDAEVMRPVTAFYTAFGQGFEKPASFATADWNHINPMGGRAKGRDAVLGEVRAVHKTFLKGVTDTIESADVRYANKDVAVVTVTSITSPYALPGAAIAVAHRQLRTFVVVKRANVWKVMQDQNTEVPIRN